jgi:hypothetical protein
MFDILLRPLKDIVVDPIISVLKYLRVSPNVFTILSGIIGKKTHDIFYLGLIAVYYSSINCPYKSLAYQLISRLLDGIDGKKPYKIINFRCICKSH